MNECVWMFPNDGLQLEGHPLHKTYAGRVGGSFRCGNPRLIKGKLKKMNKLMNVL